MRGHVWPCFSLTVAALADFRLHVYAVDGICVAETVRMQIAGVPNLAASFALASDLFLSLATAAVCALRRTRHASVSSHDLQVHSWLATVPPARCNFRPATQSSRGPVALVCVTRCVTATAAVQPRARHEAFSLAPLGRLYDAL